MKKIKKNQVIITALAIMIAVAGYINYTGNLSDIISVKDTKDASSDGVVIDENTGEIVNNDAEPDDNSLMEPGSVMLTSGSSVSDSIISEAKLNREQLRAKNKEMLMEIVNNESLDEAAKQAAVNKLADISDTSQKEIAAELLLEAKGFSNAVVSVTDGNVDVVINSTKLDDTLRAQVEDIVKRKTGLVDLVDVEAFTGDEVVKDIIEGAHAYGVKVVASNHDFDKTPDKDDIVGRLVKMQELGADIPKIAVMPQCKKDVLTLLEATREMAEEHADRPIITMSMAGTGLISRLCGEVFGSALTFGAVGKASAPGQMNASDLREILTLIDKSI